MKQSQIAWKLLLAAGLATSLGCTAEGAESIQILGNQDDCLVAPTGGFLSRGVMDVASFIDVASADGYVFTPLVQSSAASNQAAPRRFFASGADVDISFVGANVPTVSAGLEDSLRFRTLISGSIDAGGQATYEFEVVTAQLLADLVDDVTPTDKVQLIASVKIVGDLDGDGVESNTFHYPIEICDGCQTTILGPCEGLEAETEISTGGVCNQLQDGDLDCCTAPDDTPTCPAVPIIIVPDPV